MNDNIVYLLLGGVIALVSSILTSWFNYRLELRRENRRWTRETRQKEIEDVHKLMDSSVYRFPRFTTAGQITFCRLVVESGPDQGKEFAVKNYATIIGRAPKLCDFALTDPEIDDVHLRLLLVDKAFILEDVSEGKGVRVNGKLKAAPVVLENNDLIQIGDTSLHFQVTSNKAKTE